MTFLLDLLEDGNGNLPNKFPSESEMKYSPAMDSFVFSSLVSFHRERYTPKDSRIQNLSASKFQNFLTKVSFSKFCFSLWSNSTSKHGVPSTQPKQNSIQSVDISDFMSKTAQVCYWDVVLAKIGCKAHALLQYSAPICFNLLFLPN